MAKHTNAVTPCPSCEHKLSQAHPDLADWFNQSVKPRHPDCHIAWSYRPKADQDKAFMEGKSKLKYPLSMHNKCDAKGNPRSLALDLFELDFNGIGRWAYGYFRTIAQEADKDGAPIFWGGNWKKLGDFDHFQLEG